jgi:hypothetical protein
MLALGGDIWVVGFWPLLLGVLLLGVLLLDAYSSTCVCAVWLRVETMIRIGGVYGIVVDQCLRLCECSLRRVKR